MWLGMWLGMRLGTRPEGIGNEVQHTPYSQGRGGLCHSSKETHRMSHDLTLTEEICLQMLRLPPGLSCPVSSNTWRYSSQDGCR